MIECSERGLMTDGKHQIIGAKRLHGDGRHEEPPLKSINLGWNSPQDGIIGPHIWSIPPLFPTMPCSLGALLSKLPSVVPPCNTIDARDIAPVNNNRIAGQRMKVNGDVGGLREVQIADIKLEPSCLLHHADQEEKPNSINPTVGAQEGAVMELGFGPLRKGESPTLNLN